MNISDKTTGYVREVLGLEFKIAPYRLPGLPFYLHDGYDFYEAELLGEQCLLMQPRDQDESPAMVEKHCQAVRKTWDRGEVVYLAETIAAHNRKRLIQHKVSFIIPGNQLYLPALGMDLREHFRKFRHNSKNEATLSPTAQLIVLWSLLKEPVRGINSAKMGERLDCSRMAVARAYDELSSFEWASIEKSSGNQKVLIIEAEGAHLWHAAQKFLKSPVRKTRWVLGNGERLRAPLAGESALAELTLMSEPNHVVYAIAADEWKGAQRSLQLQEISHPEPGCFQLQTWYYNPDIFEKKNIVDRLSLYLSLQRQSDPRIEMATEELLEQMKW